MDFFQFLKKNLAIYTYVTVIRPLKCQNEPFVSHLLAKNLGPLISSVEAILPDFDGFLPILSKLNYLHRCNRHPTTKMPKLTLCLPPARWGPRARDFQCSGNIASFRWISFNFIKKLDHLYRCYPHPTPKMPKLTLCLPPARWEPRALDSECSGNIARFRRISSNLVKTRLFIQI